MTVLFRWNAGSRNRAVISKNGRSDCGGHDTRVDVNVRLSTEEVMAVSVVVTLFASRELKRVNMFSFTTVRLCYPQ